METLQRFLFLVILFTKSIFCCRPPVDDRVFTSVVINNVVSNISSILSDPSISKIFECTYPNTLDTTVNYTYNTSINDLDTFIITGDIDAMWIFTLCKIMVLNILPVIKSNKSICV